MKRLPSLFCLLFLLGGMMASAFVAGISVYFYQSGPLEREKTLVISAGSSSIQIASTLADEGIIRYPHLFLAGVKLFGYGKSLRAGEYLFAPNISPAAIMDMLEVGRAIVHRFVIPEGVSTAQVVARINQESALVGTITLDEVKEGELLPETYFFSYGEQKHQLIKRMRGKMQETLHGLWVARQPDLPINTPEEAVILASIVEKETGVEDERPKVAAVFINRLRCRMKLQSDPTVIYALTQGRTELKRSLTRTDLRAESPFNTYVIDALPPTPIANPGKSSLEAVLNPAVTQALYFVADGKGGHRFAATLAEHNRNVEQYRKGLSEEGE